MELHEEMLIKILCQGNITITLTNEIDINEIVQSECYKALQKINDIIKDDSFEDAECFERIEQIVCLYEKMGIGSGSRHDF